MSGWYIPTQEDLKLFGKVKYVSGREIYCPECGLLQVDEDATTCPECGYKDIFSRERTLPINYKGRL